jgi:hypothetical protein
MVEKMTHQEWLEFVGGRANGVIAVLLALAQTHPEPEKLLSHLEQSEQAGLAQVEANQLSDQYIDGMRDVIDRVRNLLRLRLERA